MATGRSMAKAAGFMMVASLIARLLGLVRDIVIYSWFGQKYITDAYNAAFSVPDFIYMLLVGGALSSAFIPVFSGYLARKQDDEAWKVASIVFNYTVGLLLILIFFAIIKTKSLIMLLAPELPLTYIQLTVTLTRVMFIQTFFMAINGITLGILNSHGHFTTPAIGSILYNVGIIGIGIGMASRWGIMAFSVGVVVGAMLNLSVQIPTLIKIGVKYTPSFDFRHPGFRQIMILMVPVMLGLSVSQINLFVTQNLASGLAEGSISALRLAQRIMQVPIGIFGISIAMALFPTMTSQAAQHEFSSFKRTFSLGLRAIFLITVPAGIGIIAIRQPIIQLMFQHGQFTSSDTLATASALLFYSLGLFAYSAQQLLNRAFYSLSDTITPVVIGAASIGINILLSVILVRFMQHQGLALAYSLAGLFNLLALMVVLRWRLKSIDGYNIVKSLSIALGASIIMFGATFLTAQYLQTVLAFSTKINELLVVVLAIGVGVGVYGGIIILFRLEETQMVMDVIKKRLPGLSLRG
ncbi:MAG: murein biosynthesis integral membrane protein MurJ [Methanomassiliicoccales archaeon]